MHTTLQFLIPKDIGSALSEHIFPSVLNNLDIAYVAYRIKCYVISC